MRINNNLMAMNTHRQLGIANTGGAKSMEKLSSGFRINRAGDDAAGLSISEKMRGQIRGLTQASRNAQDGISLIQTAEGALNESHAILQRMRELAVQAANGTNQDEDRDALQAEVVELNAELDRISDKTQFNKINLLNGTFGATVDQDTANSTVLALAGITGATSSGLAAGTWTITAGDGTNGAPIGAFTISDGTNVYASNITTDATAQTINFGEGKLLIKTNDAYDMATLDATEIVVTGGDAKIQIGANASEDLSINIGNMKASDAAGLNTSGVDISTATGATDALATIDAAISKVSEQRSNLGAKQNRLEHTIKNLDTTAENLQASESRIRDVDMAKEMMEMTKQNILQQASTAMLAQANNAPQGVLQLLR